MFSLLGRCQGLPGSQKKTGMRTASATVWWWLISLPWSQVSDFRSDGGSAPNVAMS